jgi:hypothetical protein
LPDIDPITGKSRHGFETAADIRRETRRRIRSLAAHGSARAKILAEALLRNGSSTALQSFANPFYVSELRRRLLGEVCRLAQDRKSDGLRFYSIASSKWKIRAEDLESFRPKKLLKSLRTLLNGEGEIGKLAGWAIVAFHNEYDPTTDCYQAHVHVVVCGAKYHAFEALRPLKMFKGGKGLPVYRPIQCEEIVDLPRQISYLLKGYWPAKPSAPNPATEGYRRSRRGKRIPEPRHAESLLFLDQQRFSDFVWLHGLVIKDGRLVPT